jgi:alanyl-tRNA synthetase
MISSKELKERYFAFFQRNGHKLLPNASLIPENDPTVLFTTAGMHPLVPFLLGETHPLGRKLYSVQRCIRTIDIDEVGDSWHNSFFEMLGNWSLGDYFKEEAIKLSFKFLTEELGIPKERFSVTCFGGNSDVPRDEEAAKAWEALGVSKNRIHFLKDNWWGPAGVTGPCGSDTEMFYHVKDVQEKDTKEFDDLCSKGLFCEIWNDVLMQYNKNADGSFSELLQRNVDTGMGLERTVATLNGFDSVYACDTLAPILDEVLAISAKGTARTSKNARIITDHIRAAVMLLGDNKAVVPSNVDQGYILRRFIRRSIRHGRILGIEGRFCRRVAEVVVKVMGVSYPEVLAHKTKILEELEKEEEKFSVALEHGTTMLEKMLLAKTGKKVLDAKETFDLFQSFGFPLEITVEMCKEKGVSVDEAGFNVLMKAHQELSRKGAEQKFKGGLADHSEATTKLHTATHLLNEALRQVVDKSIHQMGSNITRERLRFDFNYKEKLTDEQVKKVEAWVNDVIKAEADVTFEMMTVDEAKKAGAQGEFEKKYEEQVKVYTVHKGSKVYSREICGGPHVKNTRELGCFRITKQEAVATGVRRIKAVVS